MKYDGEFMFFVGLFSVIAIIAVCVTIGCSIYRDATIEYARAGLQECVTVGMSSTVWQKECK